MYKVLNALSLQNKKKMYKK